MILLYALACTATPTPNPTTAPTISDVALSVDPNVSTMLWVTWSQDLPSDEAWLQYDVDGVSHRGPNVATAAGAHRAALVGVPADTAIPVALEECVVSAGDEGSCRGWNLGTITTGSLPADLVTPSLSIAGPDGTAPWSWLLTSVDVGPQDFHGPFYTVILDNLGRVVWYRQTSGLRVTLFPRVARNGSELLIDASTNFVVGDPGLSRVTLNEAKDEESNAAPIGFSYSEAEDGSIYFDEDVTDTQYYLDRLSPDGTLTRLWDCYAWVAAWNTDPYGCGTNDVQYDEAHHSVLWSDYETSTVAELDAGTGALLRYFGETPGGYAIAPSDVRLKLQHSPVWTPTGNILLTTHDPNDDTAQVIREFSLDATAQTATQVWSYQNTGGYYGQEEGDVTRYDNGDTLIGYGVAGEIQHIDANGTVLAELNWHRKLTGHMTEIDDLSPLIGNPQGDE